MASGIVRFAVACILVIAASGQPLAQRKAVTPPAPTIDIRDIHKRQRPYFVAGRLGERVVVDGTVATRAINFGEYAHLPIHDSRGSGLLLERQRGALDDYSPGDVITAVGVVAQRSGLPVLGIESITKRSQTGAPQPVKVEFADLTRFDNIGKFVTFEAYVITVGRNSGGDVLVIGAGDADSSLAVFYPRFKRWEGPGLANFDAGDKVRITGIASQYCPVEPFDRGFQIIVDSPAQVVVLERGWVIPPAVVVYLLIAMVVAFVIWWVRERRMAAQRRTLHSMMSLSEIVLSSHSAGEISRRVQSVLPRVLNASNVDVFLLNKVENTLDRIPNDLTPDPLVISFDAPSGTYASAASLCYRNRTLLNVPDFRKSPMGGATLEDGLPSSAVFVPMFAQGEILGVIGVSFRKRTRANRSQQTALQHVANQVAASLKLQEQQSIREQLLRTEKMAAAGQLISGVAHDLRAPLTAIREAAAQLRDERGEPSDCLIASEAERGLQIVNHLLSFARMEGSESQAVNLHELVSTVMEAREPEWRRKSIRLENALPVSPVEVFADESELEQVVLSLLVHVEHAVENHPGKSVRLSSRVLGSRIQVSVEFAGPSVVDEMLTEPTAGDSFGLRVCQAIAQSHGGDIRLFQTPHGTFRYELELPVYHSVVHQEIIQEPERRASRVLTMILIDQDAAVQRKLLAMMSIRGHRAIPVERPEEAADMVQRMSFDVIFCTNRLPGLSWTEFFRRVRRRVSTFVLMSDDVDRDTTAAVKDGGGFVIGKPVDENEVEMVLAAVESRNAVNKS